MNVNEAIESLLAYTKKGICRPDEYTIYSFNPKPGLERYVNDQAAKASVFFMGDNADILSAIESMKDGLKDDLKDRLPLPFNSILTLSHFDEADPITPNVWLANFTARVPGHLFEEGVGYKSSGDTVILVSLIHMTGLGWCHLTSVLVDYRGMLDGKHMQLGLFSHAKREHSANDDLGAAVSGSIKKVALISHPMNYVLLESPRLNPREERRLRDGKHISDQKRPRYIIVDHDVLVKMDAGGGGTHASPTPHKRRGHWMRLSERCIHAKARGESRVFVDDHYVGRLEFDRGGSHYQVLMDFRDRMRLEGGSR